jgi:hypothetical protein
MPPQYVKAYVKRNKKDAADAAAMRSSSGMSRLRLRDGRASKSRLRGQFDKAFIPLNRAGFGLVP